MLMKIVCIIQVTESRSRKKTALIIDKVYLILIFLVTKWTNDEMLKFQAIKLWMFHLRFDLYDTPWVTKNENLTQLNRNQIITCPWPVFVHQIHDVHFWPMLSFHLRFVFGKLETFYALCLVFMWTISEVN